jgi:hypothetical protein
MRPNFRGYNGSSTGCLGDKWYRDTSSALPRCSVQFYSPAKIIMIDLEDKPPRDFLGAAHAINSDEGNHHAAVCPFRLTEPCLPLRRRISVTPITAEPVLAPMFSNNEPGLTGFNTRPAPARLGRLPVTCLRGNR